MKCVYVSGPYSAPTPVGRQRNINRAWEVASRVWGLEGAYAVCPHANTANMDGAAGPDDYEKFIEADLDLVVRCDAVLMLRGWRESRGAVRERDAAIREGMPVFHEEDDGLLRLDAWLYRERGQRAT